MCRMSRGYASHGWHWPNTLTPVLAIFGLLTATLLLTLIFFSIKFSWFYRLFRRVDKTSSRYGGELVAQVLKRHGCKFLFTLTGGHISPILVAAEKLGIEVIGVRHEATAVFAADSVSRLSGTIGVAAVTAGPGVTNTITAVKNAQMAESPVLVIGGAAASILTGRGALQDIDQLSMFKPICKYAVTVPTVRSIVPTLLKAMQIAQSGTPGPVFVQFPIDVLYKYSLIKAELGIKDEAKTWRQWITNWYLHNYLSNLFVGAWDQVCANPLPVIYGSPCQKKVTSASMLLSRARRPLIIVGSQAVLPPVPAQALASSLKRLGVPCYLGGMARGLLGRNSPLHMRQRRRDALQDADFVLLLGTVCDFRMSYGRILSKRSKVVAVNRNYAQLWRNSDMFWKPTIAAQSDPASFLLCLEEALSGYQVCRDWVEVLQQRETEIEEKNREKAEVQPPVESKGLGHFLNPLKILHALDKVMDKEDTIIVADGGDFVGTAAYILRPRGPLQWLDPGPFGTLGCGAGFALGAKLVHPDSDVWVIYGDGSFGYSLIEFDTFHRHKCPVIAVIGNDGCWGQICREQVPMLGSSTGCMLEYSDYDLCAPAFGGIGMKLDGSNNDEVEQVLEAALIKNREGKSIVLNCGIAPSDFRAGSISV